jgi:hypothetical protein
MNAEHRNESRKPTHLPARIVVDGKVHHCMLFDLSHDGARLTVASDLQLPDTFVVDLSQDGRVTRQCELIWRDGFNAGVRFAPRSPGGDPMRGFRG